jgi:hypothetical protein
MIKFHCPNCKQKLGVPDTYAGHRIRCNACSKTSIVPKLTAAASASEPISNPDKSGDDLLTAEDLFKTGKTGDSYHFSQSKIENQKSSIETPSPDDELKLKLPDPPPLPSAEQEQIRLASIKRSQEQAEEPVEIIDFPDDRIVENPPGYWPFVFPLRGHGLGMIGIFAVGNVLILASWFFLHTLYQGRTYYHRGRGAPYILAVLVWGYLCWYFKLCIQTAAEGKIRTPDVIYEFEGDHMDLAVQIMKMLLTIAASLAPAFLYAGWSIYNTPTAQLAAHGYITNPVLFWSLLAGGLFFLPMMLLSMILHDSAAGLNPILIIDSIRRTFRKYLVLLFWFFSLLGLACLIPWLLYTIISWLIIPGLAFSCYFLIVIAAILGRFFYRNEKRLDWGV